MGLYTQIADALVHLTMLSIVHRDITPMGIFIGEFSSLQLRQYF